MLRGRSPGTGSHLPVGASAPFISRMPHSMLAPTPPPSMMTHSQPMPLREKLLLGLVFVTEGLLWLEGYVRDQSEFSRLVSIIGPPGEFPFDLNFVFWNAALVIS